MLQTLTWNETAEWKVFATISLLIKLWLSPSSSVPAMEKLSSPNLLSISSSVTFRRHRMHILPRLQWSFCFYIFFLGNGCGCVANKSFLFQTYRTSSRIDNSSCIDLISSCVVASANRFWSSLLSWTKKGKTKIIKIRT